MNTRFFKKLTFAFVLTALCAFAAIAQNETLAGDTVEKDFAKNIKKYRLEKSSEGEDASSGYDYLVYKNKGEIVKIRVVWTSSANPQPRAEDHFYQNGVPVLSNELKITKKQERNVIKGITTILPITEKYYFADGKMIKWMEKGKAVAETDARWTQMGTDAYTLAKDTLEGRMEEQ